jgi:hypothetical protein
MDNNTLNLKFHGRRKINSSKKRTYKIIGTVELLIGLLGLLKSSFDMNTFFFFFLVFGIAGILNIIYGLFGKELIKEKNFISNNGEMIEYKNSFKKPKKIKTNDLLDLRIETAKVEFVHNDQRVESYDFSVFQRQELDKIYEVLEKIKSDLIK